MPAKKTDLGPKPKKKGPAMNRWMAKLRARKTTSPKRKTTSPKRKTTSPKGKRTSPKRKTTSPKRKTTSPKGKRTFRGKLLEEYNYHGKTKLIIEVNDEEYEEIRRYAIRLYGTQVYTRKIDFTRMELQIPFPDKEEAQEFKEHFDL